LVCYPISLWIHWFNHHIYSCDIHRWKNDDKTYFSGNCFGMGRVNRSRIYKFYCTDYIHPSVEVSKGGHCVFREKSCRCYLCIFVSNKHFYGKNHYISNRILLFKKFSIFNGRDYFLQFVISGSAYSLQCWRSSTNPIRLSNIRNKCT